MTINLIKPPDPSSIDDFLDEPLGLLYLATILKENGIDVKVTDLSNTGYKGYKDVIDLNSDIFGLSLYTPTAWIGLEIAKYIREHKKNALIICGGPHPSAVPWDENLHNIFDYIFMGEAEVSLLEFVQNYINSSLNSKKIIISSQVKDLDVLPIPQRDFVSDVLVYHRKLNDKRCLGIIGSRGCPFNCAFCDKAITGNRIRYRSISNIVDEIKQLIDKYGVHEFEFFDDMFTIKKSRLQEFYDKTKNWGVSYRCNGRSDNLDPKIYELLKLSGCSHIAFGLETGSQMLLDKMNKKNTVENNYRAIKLARDNNLITMGYFILGFPGETYDTIAETMDFIEKSNVDQIQFYTFIPLPGCDVYNNPNKYGARIISSNFSEYFQVTGTDGLGGMVCETDLLSAEQIREEMIKIRKYIKERTGRGSVQDYYKVINEKI